MQSQNSSPTVLSQAQKHDKRQPGMKEEFRYTEMLLWCSKTHCCDDVTTNKYKFSNKGLNKRVLEQSGDGPLEKSPLSGRKYKYYVRGFRTNNHAVAIYIQIKKRHSCFYLQIRWLIKTIFLTNAKMTLTTPFKEDRRGLGRDTPGPDLWLSFCHFVVYTCLLLESSSFKNFWWISCLGGI